MKRILAVLLAVLMVMSVMVFTTAAEETTTLPTAEFVPIVTHDNMPTADCDYATLSSKNIGGIDWRSVGTSSRISYENASKAVCLTFPEGATDKTGFHFKCNPYQSYKGMTTLGFDLYISNIAAADVNGNWKMHLLTTGGELTLSAPLSQLAVWSGITLKTGWNRFEIPVGCFNKASTTMTLTEFKFYKNNANASGSVTYKLKNVYFANDIVPTVMASSFGSLASNADVNSTNMKTKPYMSSVGGAPVKYNAGQDYTCAQYQKSGLVPNGYGFRIDTDWAGMDITKMNKFCFDLFISNIAYVDTAAQWRVQLVFTDKTDKTGTKEYNSNTNTTLANYAAMSGITLKTGWNHFELPMTAQGDSTVGLVWAASHNTDAKGLKYIRIYTNDASKQIGAEGKTLTIGLKNAYFANDGIEWATAPTTKLLMDADMATMTATEQADATTWHSSVKPQLRKYGGTNALFYDTTNKGLGFKVTGSVTNTYGIQVKVANTDTTNMTKLHFDMYLSDIDHFIANGGTWKLQLTTTATARAITNIVDKGGLAAFCGGSLVSGWNHVEIPLSVFSAGGKTVTEFIIHKKNNDAYGAAGEDTTVLINNIYFEGELPESGSATVATAEPTLTNSFEMAYTLSGTNMAYKPVVDVTFGGTTTRQPIAADGSFGLKNILAHKLSDTITTTVTAMDLNGDIFKKTNTYSVKQYCDDVLGTTTDAELKALLSDALYYGAAVQKVRGYNTTNLATSITNAAKMTAERALDTNTLTAYAASPLKGSAAEGGPKWKSATLVLSGEMNIRYTFTADSIDGVTVKVNDTEYAIQTGDGVYFVDVPVNAALFAEDFVAQFGENDSYTVTYSVNAYVARNYKRFNEKDGGSDMYNLIKAIYNYGVSAEAYAN